MELFQSYVVTIFSLPCILTDDGSALVLITAIAGGPPDVPSPGSTVAAAADTPAFAEVLEPWKIKQRMSLMMQYTQKYTAIYSNAP